jgi:hypothetical protein
MDALSIGQKQDTKTSSWLRWFLAVAGILLVYIFASGPAARLEAEGLLPFTLVHAIYDPLESVCSAHQLTSEIYDRYLRFWGVIVLNRGPIYDPVIRRF